MSSLVEPLMFLLKTQHSDAGEARTWGKHSFTEPLRSLFVCMMKLVLDISINMEQTTSAEEISHAFWKQTKGYSNTLRL